MMVLEIQVVTVYKILYIICCKFILSHELVCQAKQQDTKLEFLHVIKCLKIQVVAFYITIGRFVHHSVCKTFQLSMVLQNWSHFRNLFACWCLLSVCSKMVHLTSRANVFVVRMTILCRTFFLLSAALPSCRKPF